MKIYDKLSMNEAIEQLNEWTAAYDEGHPKVSDAEWDKLYFELQEAEERLGIIFPNSPTQKITYTVVNELQKVQHEYQPMLSLAKTKDIDKIQAFLSNKSWLAMLKLDGLTCRVTYKDGKLFRAETRGDGEEGEDITHNAMVIPSIPKTIPYKDTFVVDGEMICDTETFKQFESEYANPRNFAAGSIRLLDSRECARRGLTFVAWDCIVGYENDDEATLGDKLNQLDDYNFTVVPYFLPEDFKELEAVVDTLQDLAVREHFPIDGIVFKWNNCVEYLSAGRTEHHFSGGMAYKFEDEKYETQLIDIEWSMGRTGVLTPVAIYEDTEIDGAICNRASMHNINTMKEVLGEHPYIGQRIWIVKQNQIIPQVAKAEQAFDDTKEEFNIPQICPVCGGSTEVRIEDSGTIALWCTNDQCPGKLVNTLDHFCSIKGLNIKGLSKATIEKLIEWGWVETIVDLFLLNHWKAEWIKKPGFGEKSVQKILDAIAAASHTELSSFIAAIGIPLIGKSVAKEICKYVDTWEEFRSLIRSNFDFTEWDGFGPEKDRSIKEFDYLYADYIVERGLVEFTDNATDDTDTNSGVSNLSGLSICVTGKLKTFSNRAALKARLESLGARVTDSVTSKTSYLVNNDITSTSSKNLKAKELNIPIITETELLAMIGE